MKVTQENVGTQQTYKFTTDNDNLFFVLRYTDFPGCCMMGILHNFQPMDTLLFEENITEIGNFLSTIISERGINQLIFTDIQFGYGFKIAASMGNAECINTAFNANSGNYVYTFVIYDVQEK